jgi:hypothetical protein
MNVRLDAVRTQLRFEGLPPRRTMMVLTDEVFCRRSWPPLLLLQRLSTSIELAGSGHRQ